MKKITSLALVPVLLLSSAITTSASEVEQDNYVEMISSESQTATSVYEQNPYTNLENTRSNVSIDSFTCAATYECSIESTIPTEVNYLDSYNYSVDVVAGSEYGLLIEAPLGGEVTLDSITHGGNDITENASFTDLEVGEYSYESMISFQNEYTDAVTFNFTITTVDDTDETGIYSIDDNLNKAFVTTFLIDENSFDENGDLDNESYGVTSDILEVNFKEVEITAEIDIHTIVDENNNFTANFLITNVGETSFYIPSIEVSKSDWSDAAYETDDVFYIDGYEYDEYIDMLTAEGSELDPFLSNGESITISFTGTLINEEGNSSERNFALSVDSLSNILNEQTIYTTDYPLNYEVVALTFITPLDREEVVTETTEENTDAEPTEQSTDTEPTVEITEADDSEGQILDTGFNTTTSLLALTLVGILVALRKIAVE